jgi:hypothetical protein
MSAHVDPIPREARPFQGHRAGLVTRTTAVAVDLGIVIIALGVTYLGVFAFLFLLDPKLHRSDAVAWVGVCHRLPAAHRLSRGELDEYWPHLRQPGHGVAPRKDQLH